MKYATLVFKNLTRSKRRTILTVLSIAVSLFIFSALVSMPTVANQILADTASSTRIAMHNKAGLTYSIPSRYTQRIAAMPHVEWRCSRRAGSAASTTKFPTSSRTWRSIPRNRQDVARLGHVARGDRAVQNIRTACLVGPRR